MISPRGFRVCGSRPNSRTATQAYSTLFLCSVFAFWCCQVFLSISICLLFSLLCSFFPVEQVVFFSCVFVFFLSLHTPRHGASTQLCTCLHMSCHQRTRVGSSCAITSQSSISHGSGALIQQLTSQDRSAQQHCKSNEEQLEDRSKCSKAAQNQQSDPEELGRQRRGRRVQKLHGSICECVVRRGTHHASDNGSLSVHCSAVGFRGFETAFYHTNRTTVGAWTKGLKVLVRSFGNTIRGTQTKIRVQRRKQTWQFDTGKRDNPELGSQILTDYGN